LDQYRIGHGLSLVTEGADGVRVRRAAPGVDAGDGGTDANGAHSRGCDPAAFRSVGAEPLSLPVEEAAAELHPAP
jgi:hypothetical protein